MHSLTVLEGRSHPQTHSSPILGELSGHSENLGGGAQSHLDKAGKGGLGSL